MTFVKSRQKNQHSKMLLKMPFLEHWFCCFHHNFHECDFIMEFCKHSEHFSMFHTQKNQIFLKEENNFYRFYCSPKLIWAQAKNIHVRLVRHSKQSCRNLIVALIWVLAVVKTGRSPLLCSSMHAEKEKRLWFEWVSMFAKERMEWWWPTSIGDLP